MTQHEGAPAWVSLPAPPCPSPTSVAIREEAYRIEGASWADLRAAIAAAGPADADGELWAGQTSQVTRVTCSEGAGGLSLTVQAEIVVALPAWNRRGSVEVPYAEWEDYLVRLREHEAGHVARAWPALACLQDRLRAAATCAEAFDRHDGLIHALSVEQAAYDTATQHGTGG